MLNYCPVGMILYLIYHWHFSLDIQSNTEIGHGKWWRTRILFHRGKKLVNELLFVCALRIKIRSNECRFLVITLILKWQYRPGNVGIILSIPHGGSKEDSCIPDRSNSYGMVDNLQQDAHVDTCQVLPQYFIPYGCLKVFIIILYTTYVAH